MDGYIAQQTSWNLSITAPQGPNHDQALGFPLFYWIPLQQENPLFRLHPKQPKFLAPLKESQHFCSRLTVAPVYLSFLALLQFQII